MNRSTLILTVFLTLFATPVIVTIANWFVYNNIQSAARAKVVSEIQMLSSKESK